MEAKNATELSTPIIGNAEYRIILLKSTIYKREKLVFTKVNRSLSCCFIANVCPIYSDDYPVNIIVGRRRLTSECRDAWGVYRPD